MQYVDLHHSSMPYFSGDWMLENPSMGADLDTLGLEAWELLSMDVAPDTILDIRTVEQFARAHLTGAINVTYNNFQLDALGLIESSVRILVVDEAGARAAEMAVWLRGQGVSAQYLVGGLAAWRGPMEKS